MSAFGFVNPSTRKKYITEKIKVSSVSAISRIVREEVTHVDHLDITRGCLLPILPLKNCPAEPIIRKDYGK
jgi:hypothetical protein